MNNRPHPVAGEDCPRTYQEFLEWFSDELACRRYIVRCRWPNGFECAQCGNKTQPWTTARGYLHCRRCGSETSVTAGTIFERTRIPLRTWFAAMWFVTSQKDGASALGLICGCVEVDETYVGGRSADGKRGRGSERKEIVVIAVEVHSPKGFGRVRMRRIPDVSGVSLVPFVCDVAEKGSEILTDGWGGYNELSKCGYRHKRVVLSDTGDPAHVSMPGVHRVAALLKRWLMGTHQGSVSEKHLDYYLDEYTFRFNRRTSRSRGMLFYRLMEQAVMTAPLPYRQIVRRKHNI